MTQPKVKNDYEIATPHATHRRAASCKEVECQGWREGWRILVDTTIQLGRDQRDHFVSGLSKRRFTQLPMPEGKILFTFESEQPCFRQRKDSQIHSVSLERDPNLKINGGSLITPTEFTDTYNENAYQANQRRKRG